MSASHSAKDIQVRDRQLKVQSISVPFTIDGAPSSGSGPNLGLADSFGILGSSTVTNTGGSVVTGDLGLSPGSSVTGFPPGTVVGTEHVTDATAAQAQLDANTAYVSLAARSVTTNYSGTDLGTLTLTPGVYKYNTSAQLTGTLTLDAQNNANSVFIFQIGTTLTTASASSISLINGATAGNVFFQVGSSATLGTTTNFFGTIIALASITLNTSATLHGRALALTGAVTLDTNAVTVVEGSFTPAQVSINSDETDVVFFKTQFTDQITGALSPGEVLPTYTAQNDVNGMFSVLIVINEPLAKVVDAYIVRRTPGVSGEEMVSARLANTNGISEDGNKIALNVDSGENLAVNSLDSTLVVFYITSF